MVSELIQALGGILNIKWVRDAAVTEGTYCTAQGVLKQVGDVGVALASLAIALHTFMVIVFRWRPPKSSTLPIIVISSIWIFLALIIGLSFASHKGKTYYGDTKYWCWITKDYLAEGIALEYVWMWTAALLNIALYIPITLVLKGLITVDGFHVHFHGSKERYRSSISSKPTIVDRIATKMLAYPALYTCTVLPIAIVRWDQFYNHTVPWPATVIADVIFSSSGLLNVLLYTITRPTLIPHREHESFSTNTLRMDYPTNSFNSILSPHTQDSHSRSLPINSIALTSVVPVDPSSPSTLGPKTPAELMEPIKLRVLTSSPVHR
ncbi:hypothetical protein NLI96_g8203 [Meripilus lineatus]|uniref:Glucose receptor Git3 N-terminal domain-containing protein n=1 Tax=Meripilus lineatus TaxID=2056292 RepID=A0AAD5V2X8_9APHY|nr:hypothetical protein NLI96_g8203 [Physisporinus lineatus]